MKLNFGSGHRSALGRVSIFAKKVRNATEGGLVEVRYATLILLGTLLISSPLLPAAPAATNTTDALPERLKALEQALGFVEQTLTKNINDVIWFRRLEDIAEIDKVRYTGPPPRVTNN